MGYLQALGGHHCWLLHVGLAGWFQSLVLGKPQRRHQATFPSVSTSAQRFFASQAIERDSLRLPSMGIPTIKAVSTNHLNMRARKLGQGFNAACGVAANLLGFEVLNGLRLESNHSFFDSALSSDLRNDIQERRQDLNGIFSISLQW